jgi:hypothetical protein
MSTSPTRQGFSFARMMVLAQRRHEARMAEAAGAGTLRDAALAGSLRAELAQRTLDHLAATRRLVAVMQGAVHPA